MRAREDLVSHIYIIILLYYFGVYAFIYGKYNEVV